MSAARKAKHSRTNIGERTITIKVTIRTQLKKVSSDVQAYPVTEIVSVVVDNDTKGFYTSPFNLEVYQIFKSNGWSISLEAG